MYCKCALKKWRMWLRLPAGIALSTETRLYQVMFLLPAVGVFNGGGEEEGHLLCPPRRWRTVIGYPNAICKAFLLSEWVEFYVPLEKITWWHIFAFRIYASIYRRLHTSYRSLAPAWTRPPYLLTHRCGNPRYTTGLEYIIARVYYNYITAE